jgi:putative NIF3 family GTP cyclohydrolase 1 type 2
MPIKFWSRRDFLATTLTALAAPIPLTKSLAAENAPEKPATTAANPALTIQQVINALLADIPGAPFPHTVDTIKAGDPSQPVKGIVTTMFATDAIIQKTIDLKANFIIAHEPTFYNHTDETDWLGNDPVFQYKRDLLSKNSIVVWRFHDGMHAHKPDLIRLGVLADVGWQDAYVEGNPLITLPQAMPLEHVIGYFKHLLGIPKHIKYIGDLAQSCKKLVISPGAAGGRSQIAMIQKYQPDVFICGELNEWETSEYIRDARFQGKNIALIVLGHSVSEESGLEVLLSILKQKFPDIPVNHFPSGDPFDWA